MMIDQNEEMHSTNLFADNFVEYKSKWEQEILLEPDKSVNGALAFRLTGSKTHGAFIQSVDLKSKQSKILCKGDQILRVNGVDVRRFTCDQIVNVLRIVLCKNGHALVQVRRQKQFPDDKLNDIDKDENSNLQYFYSANDNLAENNNNNNSTLPLSFSDMTELCQSTVYARVSRHYYNDYMGMECEQLVCFNETKKQQFSLCTQKRKFSMFGYMEQLSDSENDYEYDQECSSCLKYSTKWHWHTIKHRWILNAMKFLPKSASDFFGLRFYQQKTYYNLI